MGCIITKSINPNAQLVLSRVVYIKPILLFVSDNLKELLILREINTAWKDTFDNFMHEEKKDFKYTIDLCNHLGRFIAQHDGQSFFRSGFYLKEGYDVRWKHNKEIQLNYYRTTFRLTTCGELHSFQRLMGNKNGRSEICFYISVHIDIVVHNLIVEIYKY